MIARLGKELSMSDRMPRGEFIARMDADDLALPNRIQDQLDYLGRSATS